VKSWFASDSGIRLSLLGCGGNCSNTPTAPVWAPTDYDSLWTLILDAQGNLTADFTQCEGIDSAALPAAAPQF
jgi:hypothetical protein